MLFSDGWSTLQFQPSFSEMVRLTVTVLVTCSDVSPWPWALALEVWRSPKIQGQNLGELQNSPLTSVDSSEFYFKIHVPYLLTVYSFLRIMLSVMSDVINLCMYSKKTGFHYFIFYRKPLHYGMALALALGVLALLTSLVTCERFENMLHTIARFLCVI